MYLIQRFHRELLDIDTVTIHIQCEHTALTPQRFYQLLVEKVKIVDEVLRESRDLVGLHLSRIQSLFFLVACLDNHCFVDDFFTGSTTARADSCSPSLLYLRCVTNKSVASLDFGWITA